MNVYHTFPSLKYFTRYCSCPPCPFPILGFILDEVTRQWLLMRNLVNFCSCIPALINKTSQDDISQQLELMLINMQLKGHIVKVIRCDSDRVTDRYGSLRIDSNHTELL